MDSIRVAELFDSILVEDLTHIESLIVKMLVKDNLLRIVNNDLGDPVVQMI